MAGAYDGQRRSRDARALHAGGRRPIERGSERIQLWLGCWGGRYIIRPGKAAPKPKS